MSLTRQAGKRNTKYHAGPERDRHRIARPIATRTRPHTGSADRRHSVATRWLRDGVSIEVVSKLLGHSSVTTTSAIYGKSRELHQAGEKSQVARSARCLAGLPGVYVRVA